MSFVARLRSRRIAVIAAAIVLGLATSALTQVAVAPQPASAAGSNFLCDNNTIYGIIGSTASGGAVGDLMQINASDGTSVKVGTLAPGSNALGLTKNGTQAWAFQSGSNKLVKYDAVAGTSTTINIGGANITAIRGAVNPVTNIYYYASSGTPSTLYAYDINTSTAIGEVATISGGKGNNGDMAFGTDGTLYMVDSDQVFRITNVPATAGTTALAGTLITTLPANTNSPGIAYSADGYLYLVANTTSSTLYKIDPGSGTVAATLTISTGASVYDLASCNYANSLRTQADVRSRAATSDEFTLTNNGFTSGNTATTTGSATGIQAAVAGPNLAVGLGSYSVTQSAAGTTTLANYSVGWSCYNNTTSTTVASGTGNTASFTYPQATTADGSDVVCTFVDAVLPAAANDSYSTPINTTLTVNATNGVLANDSGASITVTSNTNPSHGTVTVAANGSFSYVPASGYTGPDSFDYTITDVNGTTSTATATIHVTPTAANDSYSTPVNTALVISDLTANDNPTTMTVQSVTTPAHGTATLNGNGTVTYTPNNGYTGADTFSYTAADASGQPATATVTINVAAGDVDDYATTTANTPVNTPVLTANDYGTGVTVQSITQPGHGTAVLNGNGTVTYTPANNFSGSDTFTYTTTDSSNNSSGATVHLTVTPTATNDAATTSTNAAVTVSGLTSNDHGSSLTVTAVTQPSHGSAVLNGNGTVTYTPANNFSGTDTVPYTVTDGSGQTATANIVITVTPTGADDAGTTTANTALTVTAANGVLANDHGSALAVTAYSAPSHGAVNVASDGSYVYTPTTGYSGPDSFSYTATDSSNQTVTQTVRITVTPSAANDSATTAANQPVTTNVVSNDAGTSLTITTVGTPSHGSASLGSAGTIVYTPTTGYSGNDSVSYTVTDASGQTATAVLNVTVNPVAANDSTSTTVNTPVTVSQATLTSNDVGIGLTVTAITQPTHGTATLSNGNVTYTPSNNYSGPDSLSYTVTDSAGHTSSATLSIVVGNVAAADTGTTPANTTLNVDAAHGVLANDSGTGLTATIATNPSHGTVTLNSDGSYQYVPTTGFSGTDTFTYTSRDSSNNTATGTVTITVTPTAVDDSITVNAGSPFTLAAPGVLSNDIGTGLHVTANTTPGHGTVTVSSDGSLTYTPAAGYSGPDSFTYTVTDAAGNTSTATVNVSVKPVVQDADPSTTVGTPVTVDAAHGLLAGAVGSGLTASLTTPPTHGTVVVNPDGSYTYTPNPGFVGDDTFGFAVTDSSNQTTNGTATVSVVPPAAANPDTVQAQPGQTVMINPLTNDQPSSGATFDASTLRIFDPSTSTWVLQVIDPAVGTWKVVGSQLEFAPVSGYTGTASIRYQVTDTAGTTVTSTASAVYSAKAALAFTGTDRAELEGMAGGGLAAMFLGLGLLLFGGVRRRLLPKRTPRHSTMVA